MSLVKVSGIYKIQSKTTKKFYIGSSIFIGKRWQKHLSCLKSNTHVNYYLQNHVNKYGIEDLEFSIIDVMENITKENRKDLLTKEQFYIDELKPKFNLQKIVGSHLHRKFPDAKYYHYSKASKLYLVSYVVLGESLNFSYHVTEDSAIKQVEFIKTLTDEQILTYCKSLKKEVKNYSYDTKTKKYIVQFDIHGKTQRLNSFSNESEAIELATYLRSLTKLQLENYLKDFRDKQSSKTGKYYSYCKTSKKYVVSYPIDGKFKKLQSFSIEQDAKNFVSKLKTFTHLELLEFHKNKPKPKYYCYTKNINKYVVTFKVGDSRRCFGRYDTEQEAIDRVEELKPILLPLLSRRREQ
jgi:group I intron endonuclease